MLVMEDFLTVEEVAKKLQLHPDTVARLLRAGELPGYKVAGSWRISPTELQKYMEQRSNKRTDKKS